MTARNFKDLSGRRFGTLEIVERATNSAGKARWCVKCNCGCERQGTVFGCNLLRSKNPTTTCLSFGLFRNNLSTNVKERWCGTCKSWVILSEFSNNAYTKHGFSTQCKNCRKITDKTCGIKFKEKGICIRCCKNSLAVYSVQYCKGCFSKTKNNKYGKLYGWYEEQLQKQNKVCAVCHLSSKKALVVDHDHTCCSAKKSCGKCVRGIVCTKCNILIGYIERSLLDGTISFINPSSLIGDYFIKYGIITMKGCLAT